MSKFLKTFILSSLVLTAVFLFAGQAEAAIISIIPNDKDINYGETFIVDVRFNSEQEIINAIQATLTYPANMLDIIEVNKGGSFLTLWPQEPTVDEELGTIKLAGGIPHGSYIVDGRILRLTFRAISSGSLEIGFDSESTSVHLNDGYGTPTETELKAGIYRIFPAVLININSPTHPDEDIWYQNNSPIFQWTVNSGSVYSYTLATNPDKLPDQHPEAVTGEVFYTDLSDGTYYFILSERQPDNTWAVVGRRRVMIDQTPPQSFEFEIGSDPTIYSGANFLAFSTTDLTSGIDHYEVKEGLSNYKNATTPYLLRSQSLDKKIIVRAFDKAGNYIESGDSSTAATKQQPVLNVTLLILIGVIIISLIFLLFLSKLHKKK